MRVKGFRNRDSFGILIGAISFWTGYIDVNKVLRPIMRVPVKMIVGFTFAIRTTRTWIELKIWKELK